MKKIVIFLNENDDYFVGVCFIIAAMIVAGLGGAYYWFFDTILPIDFLIIISFSLFAIYMMINIRHWETHLKEITITAIVLIAVCSFLFLITIILALIYKYIGVEEALQSSILSLMFLCVVVILRQIYEIIKCHTN